MMNTKELLLQEINQAPDPILDEVLDFLRFLKAKQQQQALENQLDLEEARAVLEEIEQEGTISWESLKSELS
ncbi:DUF2281 domain-containing protein [Leptolyngbya sp. NIES-2104]|uniref:DUF2281 domain-containing protein n=1 Tax=Leptolyngbya sp. NIES-2104 TaxID=1552121 RepID=UPI0006EC719C|nr:DUF2281 domain-containing protein [Leptolyngbya sp. NIES-2104]GAP95728.1 hypothetical protein NIES2104_22520 [Leptolyngbya sp. NIES-2104]